MTSTAQAIDLPFEEAIDFFRQKTNVYTHRWNDLWKEAHSRGFMVAGAASEGLLSDFREAVDKAIAKGTTLAEFRADFDAIVKKHGWEYHGTPGWRSRVIYETNLAGAYSAGRYRQMADPDVTAMYPYWRYVHSGSQHPRLQHLAWDGLTLSCDDPFWDSHYPPNGWHCGCRVAPVSRAGLARMGKDAPDQAPPVQMRTWIDKKTGTPHLVPVGIDPGFDYNPGKAWANAPVRAPKWQEKPGPGTPRHPDADTPLPKLPEGLRRFLEAPEPEGEHQVGELSRAAQRALGTTIGRVVIDAPFVARQRKYAPGVAPEDYAALTELLRDPTVILMRAKEPLLLLRRSGRVFAASMSPVPDEQLLRLRYFDTLELKAVQDMLTRYDQVYGDADDLSDD